MNIYIIIRDGVANTTAYTSIKTVSRLVKGPHLNTLYTNLKNHGIYRKDNLLIQKLSIEKLPNRNDHPTFKAKGKIRTIGLYPNNQRFSSNTSEVDTVYED